MKATCFLVVVLISISPRSAVVFLFFSFFFATQHFFFHVGTQCYWVNGVKLNWQILQHNRTECMEILKCLMGDHQEWNRIEIEMLVSVSSSQQPTRRVNEESIYVVRMELFSHCHLITSSNTLIYVLIGHLIEFFTLDKECFSGKVKKSVEIGNCRWNKHGQQHRQHRRSSK